MLFGYQGTEPPAPCPRCAERIRTNPRDKDLICPHRVNQQKKRFLKKAITKIANGALAAEFQLRKKYRQVKQEDLAACAGESRAHYTKGTTQFANPDESWDDARRKRHSAAQKEAARAKGLKVDDERDPRQPLPRVAPNLFYRNRRFAGANVYAWGLFERTSEWWVVEKYVYGDGNLRIRVVKRGFMLKALARAHAEQLNVKNDTTRYEVKERPLPKDLFHLATMEGIFDRDDESGELLHPDWARLFDKRLLDRANGFFETSEMFHHPKFADVVGGDAILALDAYFACGLLGEMGADEAHRLNEKRREAKEGGKLYEAGDLRDRVYVHQAVIAQITGLDLKAVYRANQRLEAIGLLQIDGRRGAKVTEDPVTKERKWTSECQCVIFRPLEGEYRERARLRRERRKLLAKVKQLRDDQQRAVLNLYDDLRRDEKLHNVDRAAFYEAFRTAVLKLHVPERVASDLLYCPPPRPPT